MRGNAQLVRQARVLILWSDCTDDGNLYGIEKDSSDGLKTFINPKTRVPNLFLTGANINLHGILGVSISALVTCFEFVDRAELLEKVHAAGKAEG